MGNFSKFGKFTKVWEIPHTLGISKNFAKFPKVKRTLYYVLLLFLLRHGHVGAAAAHTRFLAADELQGKGLGR